MTTAPANRRLAWALAAALAVATCAIFLQVRDFRFLILDDNRYVYENPHVAGGLSASGIAWAFTTMHAANWHPLTWLSHMADVELFGMDSGRHHLVNAALHAMNSVLLLFLLFRMTGSPWKSGFVAGLFAVHPLHVESVAWISERKDVLSALFSLLAVRAYLGYVTRGGKGRYLGCLVLFVSALLSKPMAVTLPFLLLLLDFWPLGRFGTVPSEVSGSKGTGVPARHLLFEKLPFFLLSAVSCVVTFVAQERGGAVNTGLEVPFGVRISNALVAYAAYLCKTVWPVSLSAFYPHPWEAAGGIIPLWQMASAILLIAGISTLSLWRLKTDPYLAFGWFSYLGLLVPVIGVVEVGRQAMADRYTYLPLIGIFIMVAWGIPKMLAPRLFGRRVLIVGGCAALLALAAVSCIQVSYWRDDISLFGHAAEIDPGNAFAHNNIGIALLRQGRPLEAMVRFERALSTGYSSHTIDALNFMGLTLTDLGMLDKAADCFRRGLTIDSGSPKLRSNLSEVLFRQGKIDDAVREMDEAARLDPGNRDTLRRLEKLRSFQGRESHGSSRP